MQTQRDHVHAHQFQMTRMTNALVIGDSQSADNPFRRPIAGLLLGIVIAVLVVASFAIYGWLVPGGNTSWRNQSTIIVEKETGNRYVYLAGLLRPTLNLASAMLIEGPGAQIKLVSRKSLAGVPHGPLIGLAGAPQVLPDPSGLVAGPWLTCLSAGAPQGIRFDFDPAAPSVRLAPNQFMLVTAKGQTYLLWQGKKFEVTSGAVQVALGATTAQPVTATTAWLDQLPTGDAVGLPAVPDRGAAGPEVAGQHYLVGQLFVQAGTGGAAQRFVLRKDGLAPVDLTAYTLLKAVGKDPVELSAADILDAPRSSDRSLTTFLPSLGGATYRDPGGRSLCLRQAPIGNNSIGSEVVLGDRVYTAQAPVAVVKAGTGLIVYPAPVGKGKQADPYLITDNGIRYHVSGQDTRPSLGLDGPQVPFPAALLDDITSGPELSRTAVTHNPEG